MSDAKSKRLSREEIANIEIGHTEVSRARQWALTLFFLSLITVYPVCQFCTRPPFAEWRDAGTAQASIKAYETAVEDASLLRQWLLAPAQRLLTSVCRTGNEKVILGHDGWLFFSGDCEYLLNPGFMMPGRMHKRLLSGVEPDPVAAVLDFNRQLRERGIQLILLPVPVKPMIYPDKLSGSVAPLHNPDWRMFCEKVEADGVKVVKLADTFASMRVSGEEPYLKTDTHWTPAGMRRAAEVTSELLDPADNSAMVSVPAVRTNLGDIAVMLKLPDCEKYFPAETVKTEMYDIVFDRNSDVLLMGDSFTNIYSLEAMKWGIRAGFAETLSACIGRPVDVIARNDAGAFATRQILAGELRRGRDRLAGKRFVVWEFAVRELANGDWKILDMTPGEPAGGDFITVEHPREVTGEVLAVSSVPRPGSAPYKDHVMSVHLADINGGGEQALVYMVSMRDDVWTDAAGLRSGDKVKLRLLPWSGCEAEFGSWSRSEFDDDGLLLAEPCFGKIIP